MAFAGRKGAHLFLLPITLADLARLTDPSERVPLGERLPYEQGTSLIERNAFERAAISKASGPLRLEMFFKDEILRKIVTATIREERPQGPLSFSCSDCVVAGRAATSGPHQWAAYQLLWKTLALPKDDLQTPALVRLRTELNEYEARGDVDSDSRQQKWNGVQLDSISLFFEENALLKGESLGQILPLHVTTYVPTEVAKADELMSPRLWNLPEVFRKKLTAYSEHYFHEINKQNRMAGVVAYNFSNGMQINLREVLRHPLHKKIPLELLPALGSPAPALSRWSLLPLTDAHFVSQSLNELEGIMQSLLARIAELQRRNQLEVYLQATGTPGRAMKVQTLEFDPAREVDWRVTFLEKKELESEFKLVSFRKRPMHFYESFAVEPEDGAIVIHPWQRELSSLQEKLGSLSNHLRLTDREMPRIDVVGELETKSLLRYLRTRPIPVKIAGESRTLHADQSRTEIRLDEKGKFYLQHEARIPDQKTVLRRGWTSKSALFLQTLSKGLPYLLHQEAKELAARSRVKREWDLKLLKHLGILQYLAFETLSLHFEGKLSDGTKADPDDLINALAPKIQALLIAGSSGLFVREAPLAELCSKPVLSAFQEFVNITLKSMLLSESFYSEEGEVILDGLTERELRLVLEMLRFAAVATGGETFRRSRSSFLDKISNDDPEKDPTLISMLFHFPGSATAEGSHLQSSLESLQELIPRGFKIFYRDQPLQELADDEFQVDFVLRSDDDPKMYNWFELNPKFFLRGQEVDPENFLTLGAGGVIEYEGKLFMVPQKQLPSLRRLENFWQKLQKGKTESSRRKNGDKIYRLPRNQTLELLALRSSGVGIRGDEEWKKLCDFYDGLGTQTRELDLSPELKAVLKPYQVLGVQWLQDLYGLKLGALLADDMGLGKTLQTLTFLEGLREKEDLGQVLIIVPSSLIFNWQDEARKFTPKLTLNVFSGKDADALGRKLGLKEQTVVIATYGLLLEHEAFFAQFRWKILVFDEAQNLKNISTRRTSAARALNANFKICLTGTPMENHYGEFYSLVDLLVPGSLGKIEDFRRQFVNTEMVTREELDDLKLKIKPLMLRRTKKEILDQLPDKQETKVSIAFEERQREIYRDIALSYNQRVQETMAIQGEASVQLQMLTALLRLRQACSDPAALPNVRYDKVPPKLETLLDSLQEIVESGESALVFTQFLQTLEHTAKILREANIPVFVLHGGVPTKQRQKILEEFSQMVKGAVLLMTLKTGGVGLNLTKASYVFHLEPWWNPSVENQATDRAHRLGQSKAVQVFRYIMHESLEEKIELLKHRKDRKFQSLFAATEKDADITAGTTALTKQDFDFLLGLKDD